MIRLRVKELAREQGLSQSKLSRKADIDVRVIQRIYHNPATNITMFTLERLAIGLGVHPRDLIEWTPDT
jgi:DNA-binding Xre family transcriptional regulator